MVCFSPSSSSSQSLLHTPDIFTCILFSANTQPIIEKDLLHPTALAEKHTHKKKRLVAAPNSYFMDVKCTCGTVSTVFSHANTVVVCPKCNHVIAQPAGGLAKITSGCLVRRKVD